MTVTVGVLRTRRGDGKSGRNEDDLHVKINNFINLELSDVPTVYCTLENFVTVDIHRKMFYYIEIVRMFNFHSQFLINCLCSKLIPLSTCLYFFLF